MKDPLNIFTLGKAHNEVETAIRAMQMAGYMAEIDTDKIVEQIQKVQDQIKTKYINEAIKK